MNALWRLKIDQWHMICVLIVLSTCFVCRDAPAQDNVTRAKIFLDGEMKHAPAQQTYAPEVAQPPHLITSSRLAPLPFYVNAFQYLIEKRGKIPVISGMDGKLQLEFGLFGYLGVKYSF